VQCKADKLRRDYVCYFGPEVALRFFSEIKDMHDKKFKHKDGRTYTIEKLIEFVEQHAADGMPESIKVD